MRHPERSEGSLNLFQLPLKQVERFFVSLRMTKVFPISKFTVNGNSMFPTLHPGQDILSFNWAYFGKTPKIGDMVVVRVDGKDMVKRVHKIHDREVYVVGDNKEESTDSRDFGAVSLDQIVGKVIYMDSRLRGNDKKGSGHDMVDCPKCGSKVVGIYGRKDAICKNCGFKLTCCGEP